MQREGVRSFSGLISLIVALLAVSGAAPSHAADKFRKLSPAEIRAKVAGMEITDEVHWADLFNRDGTFVSWSMGKKTTGKWMVRDGALCLDDGKAEPDCREVWISGTKIEYRRPQSSFVIEGVLIRQKPRT